MQTEVVSRYHYTFPINSNKSVHVSLHGCDAKLAQITCGSAPLDIVKPNGEGIIEFFGGEPLHMSLCTLSTITVRISCDEPCEPHIVLVEVDPPNFGDERYICQPVTLFDGYSDGLYRKNNTLMYCDNSVFLRFTR